MTRRLISGASSTRRRVLVAALALSLCALSVSPAEAQTPAQAGSSRPAGELVPVPRVVRDGDGIMVDLRGATAGAETRSMTRATAGYSLFDSAIGLRSSYKIRMVTSSALWTHIDEEAADAGSELTYVTGSSVSMGTTMASHTTTTGEISVQVASTSPCGDMSDVGVIGCGAGWVGSSGTTVFGNVWICTCVVDDPGIFGILIHEMGHVFGLAHYTPSYEGQHQVMYPTYQTGLLRYRSGDVNGLRRTASNGGLAPPTHPPSPISKPSVTASLAKLNVSWPGASAYGHTIDSHQVEVENLSTSATNTVTTGSSRSASVSVLGGANYRARVRAHNSNGWGLWSSWSSSAYITGLCIAGIDDVSESNAFCADITWLLDQGIAAGYDDGGFHPTADVSRQAMAAFLMRDAERLVPGSTAGDWSGTYSFSDVSSANAFHDDIEWLASTGIATGYDDGGFHPGATVTRQAMAAFLMRFTEYLFPGSTAGDWSGYAFWDVPSTHAFHAEIKWLATEGIATGYDDGGFHPGAGVSRQAMAAFLHRHDAVV